MHIIILVPFRDEAAQNRATHLAHFRKVVPAVLDSAAAPGDTWRILIGKQRQRDGHKFARGRVLNALAAIAGKDPCNRRLILHDVDLIPNAERARGYWAPLGHSGILALNSTGEYASMVGYVGGICALSTAAFCEANGFPNEMEGWGGEDDALRDRFGGARAVGVFSPGAVQNLETDPEFVVPGQVRARDVAAYKMPKEDRLEVRKRWADRHPSVTGMRELAFLQGAVIPVAEDARIAAVDVDVFPEVFPPWVLKQTRTSSIVYYFNPKTGESSWSAPALTPASTSKSPCS